MIMIDVLMANILFIRISRRLRFIRKRITPQKNETHFLNISTQSNIYNFRKINETAK